METDQHEEQSIPGEHEDKTTFLPKALVNKICDHWRMTADDVDLSLLSRVSIQLDLVDIKCL